MTRKKQSGAARRKATDDTSSAASPTEDTASDTNYGEAATPTTGPYAHDPAQVSAPPNPAALARHPERSDEIAASDVVEDAASKTTDNGAAAARTQEDSTDTAPDTDTLQSDHTTTPEVDTARDTAPGAEAGPAASPAADSPTATERVTIRQGGFWSMLFGGALAASIGVVASPYILSSEMLAGRVPAFLAPQDQGEDEVAAQLDTQSSRLDAVETRLDNISSDIQAAMDSPAPPPDLSDEVASLDETLSSVEDRLGKLESQVSGTGGRFDDIEARLGDLGNRLTAVENRPVPTADGSDVDSSTIESLRTRLEQQRADIEAQQSSLKAQLSNLEAQQSDIAAQSSDIATLRDRLGTQAEEIASLRDAARAKEADARDSARAALRNAALTRVTTALDTGSPYADALGDLRDTGVEVPEALAETADTGVPTLGALTEAFPDAARAALSTLRDSQEGLGAVEIGQFFRNQLGMRSLTPREGDSPDAILSRAEAALRDARLGDALAEIETLPDDARAALDDWVARAERRQQALSAAETLAGTLN